MKAFNCFLMICGVLLSSDFAFGASLGIDKLVSEKKEDAAAVTFEDAIAPITNDLLKKAEERIAEVKESLIREINNQNNEDSLIQNPQNKTTKQLKIVGDKLVQTEEKVVSLGTKDNATIAIYKIINIRPLSFLVKTENSKPNKPVEQASENPNKSLDELEKSQPLAENQQSSQNDQPDQQDHSAKNVSPENDKPTQKDDSAQNEQSAQQEQPAQNETAQNDQPTQQDQTAQNESSQNGPVISITGPDGVPRVIHGIAIKVAPKSDGTQDKDVAFQFFK